MELYILEGKIARPAWDMEEWSEYMRIPPDDPLYRHVARVYYYVDDVAYCDLSTVFLGIDHNYGQREEPTLFHDRIRKKIYREFDIGGVTSTVNGKRADIFYHKLVNFTPLPEIELRLIREN